MREAEWWLDTDAYLEEQRWWIHSRTHCEYLCQQMFLHATVTSQSEHEHATCWGQRELLHKWDLRAETNAIELVSPNSTCQGIKDLYLDAYQLCRLPGRGWCKEAIEEHLCREVLDSIKEHFWLKWPSTKLEGEQQQLPASAPQPDPHMEFAAVNHSTYKKFTATHWNSYEEMMAVARDARWWALVAAAILEERM